MYNNQSCPCRVCNQSCRLFFLFDESLREVVFRKILKFVGVNQMHSIRRSNIIVSEFICDKPFPGSRTEKGHKNPHNLYHFRRPIQSAADISTIQYKHRFLDPEIGSRLYKESVSSLNIFSSRGSCVSEVSKTFHRLRVEFLRAFCFEPRGSLLFWACLELVFSHSSNLPTPKMGKKSRRALNPTDKERKKQRAQELKKNKKQRNLVRQAIVKARDPDELLEQLRRLDAQGIFFV